jgi:cellulase/cellobiase CelA1
MLTSIHRRLAAASCVASLALLMACAGGAASGGTGGQGGTGDGSTPSAPPMYHPFASAGPSGSSNAAGTGTGAGGDTTGSSTAGSGMTGEPAKDLDVATMIDNEWDTGYQESVTVTNLSSAPVTWTISLPVNGSIANLWNAIATPAGDMTTFTGKDYNAVLKPQQTASFGFVANK